LNLEWTDEMNDFDFLIATLTAPKPKRLLSGKEIAGRMIEKEYTHYFDKNRECGIETFQDTEIEKHCGKARWQQRIKTIAQLQQNRMVRAYFRGRQIFKFGLLKNKSNK
jgi:hypothetical protein